MQLKTIISINPSPNSQHLLGESHIMLVQSLGNLIQLAQIMHNSNHDKWPKSWSLLSKRKEKTNQRGTLRTVTTLPHSGLTWDVISKVKRSWARTATPSRTGTCTTVTCGSRSLQSPRRHLSKLFPISSSLLLDQSCFCRDGSSAVSGKSKGSKWADINKKTSPGEVNCSWCTYEYDAAWWANVKLNQINRLNRNQFI